MFKNILFFTILLLFTISKLQAQNDDFADFDDDSNTIEMKKPDNDFEFDEEEDGLVEDVDDNEIADRENFSFENTPVDVMVDDTEERKFEEKGSKPKMSLKETKIPAHLRNNWHQFWIEGILLLFIFWYIINFFTGKKKNEDLANLWMSENVDFLRSQFSEVGGVSAPEDIPMLNFNSYNNFTLWCTGRKGVEGIFIEINLVARQDLISIWRNKFNRKRHGTMDTVTTTVYLEDEILTEPCVLCIGQPRQVSELWKNFYDLKTFCPKGPKDKSNIAKGYIGCAENVEMFTNVFDAKTTAIFSKDCVPAQFFDSKLCYMHISDKYLSMYVEEDESKKSAMDLCSKVMVTSVQIDPVALEFNSEQFMKGIIYIVDKLKKMRLSKEARAACDKRRLKAREEEDKKMHQVRTERMQERSEARRKEMYKNIMEEEDPDKQKRLYDAQQKKEDKRRMKRTTKQVKMK